MSIATWKREFFRMPSPKAKPATVTRAVLRKWIGFREANLKKHHVWITDKLGILRDANDGLTILGHNTCAYCDRYFRSGYCNGCPLYQEREQRCFEPRGNSPYGEMLDRGYPEPMIALLEAILAKQTAKPKPNTTQKRGKA